MTLTVVMWSKSKPDVEFQYGRRLGKFNGMSSQSHVSHCRVAFVSSPIHLLLDNFRGDQWCHSIDYQF